MVRTVVTYTFTTYSPTTHSPTFPSLHLRHSSFSNPSVALPTSQHILQPFHCFTYVKAHSPTLLSFLIRHRLFSYLRSHPWIFGVARKGISEQGSRIHFYEVSPISRKNQSGMHLICKHYVCTLFRFNTTAAEILRVFSNMFNRYQVSPAKRRRHFEHLLYIKISLI